MRGLIQLQNTLSMVREELNPDIEIEGILPTLVDNRTVHAKEAIEILEENFGDRVFASRINKTVRFAEAPGEGDVGAQVRPRREGRLRLPSASGGGPGEWQAVSGRACARGPWRSSSARRRRTTPSRARSRARSERPRRGACRRRGARARPARCPRAGPAPQVTRHVPEPQAQSQAQDELRAAAPPRPPAAPRSARAPPRRAGTEERLSRYEGVPTPEERLRSVFSSDIPENIMERAPEPATREPDAEPEPLVRVGPHARPSPCCAWWASAAPA